MLINSNGESGHALLATIFKQPLLVIDNHSAPSSIVGDRPFLGKILA